MRKHFFISLTLMFLVVQTAFAQNVTFEATGQTNVAVGDQFLVRFSVNKQGINFIGPAFTDFRVLSGPNTSTNSSFSNINGRMTQSLTITYTYYLRASKEGEFIVPPAKITVDGKEYSTKPLIIYVAKERAASSPSGRTTNQNIPQNQIELQKNDILLKAEIDKANPYVGEQVILTYKIYTKVPISQLAVDKMSNFSGFWMKNLVNQADGLKQKTEIINGEEYISAELNKYALFPQKSGQIIIDPMELKCVAQLKRTTQQRAKSFFDSVFDDPFFSGYRNIQAFLESNSVTIEVKPLPENNKPINFSGAVGEFTLQSNLDKKELKTNDAVTLKFIISGQGNLELVDNFKINFPTDFEAYEPKITNDLKINSNGISGTKTFEYILIPRNPGEFEISPVEFNYFDIRSRSYKMIRTQAFNISVEKGTDYQAGVNYSGGSQEDIQYIGSDVHHLKTGKFKLYVINYYFVKTTAFILWALIPIVFFGFFIFYWKKQAAQMNNQTLMRHRRATKVARKNLKQAKQFLGTKNTTEFYNEISQALWGYLSNKFSIPLSELSKESVNDALIEKEVKEEIINQFIETLDNCDFARFAPGDPSKTMDKIYNEALEIISKIERELK